MLHAIDNSPANLVDMFMREQIVGWLQGPSGSGLLDENSLFEAGGLFRSCCRNSRISSSTGNLTFDFWSSSQLLESTDLEI